MSQKTVGEAGIDNSTEHIQFCLPFANFLTKKLLLLFKQNRNNIAGIILRQQFSNAVNGDTRVTKKADNPHSLEVIL